MPSTLAPATSSSSVSRLDSAVPRRGPLLKPRCALKVAIVGNRRFGGETDAVPNDVAGRMKARATEACSAAWRTIADGMRSALDVEIGRTPGARRAARGSPFAPALKDFFADEPPLLVVLSGLAAGADQLGAQTALELEPAETGIEVELEAVFPFAAEDYPGTAAMPRPEFRPEEAAMLTALAERARQVLRLDGSYADRASRQRAYRHGRDALLQHADLLVAVYDPRAATGDAGTVETVGEALAAGLPVVAILVAEREVRVAVYTSPSQRAANGADEWARARHLSDDGWGDEVQHRVRHLVCLPHQIAAPDESARERQTRLSGLEQAVHRLRLLYGETRVHRLCRGRVLGNVFAGAWRMMLGVGRACSHPHEFDDHTQRPDPTDDEIIAEPYAKYYRRASELTELYMRSYRGTFVLSFALAGLAVAAAVSLMAVSLLTGGHPPTLAIIGLGGLKLGVIVILLMLERASHQARYQEHATDYRYFAELLRPVQWLAPAGISVPAVELPAHVAPLDPRRGWTPWLLRAIARSTTPVISKPADGSEATARDVTFDVAFGRAALERARGEWVQGQVLYHWNNAQRMHHLDEGLERLAKALLWIVLAFAFLAVLLELLPNYVAEPWPDRVAALHPLAIVLGAGAAALPAFIAALGGIMFQSEARRLKSRSEAMYHGLRVEQQQLDEQIAALDRSDTARGGAVWLALQRLRDLSTVVLTESGHWKILYQTHEMHAG